MEKDWFKYRGYPHISDEISVSQRERTDRYLSRRTNVANHSFLPLISKTIIQRRYKRQNGFGSNDRSHKQKKEDGSVKSTKKIRRIMYSSHQDAQLYSYYAKLKIEPFYEAILRSETLLNESIIAYRRLRANDGKGNKNNIHFAKEVFDEIKNRGECVAVMFDIENFFPTLDHKLLKKIWSEVIGCKSLPKDHFNIFKSVANYSFINLHDLKTKGFGFDEKELSIIQNSGRNSYFRSVRDFLDSDIQVYKNPTKGVGIPQGLPISALLANIYMLPFDRAIIDELSVLKGVFYRRYSDDMIFICNKEQVEEIKSFVVQKINEIQLSISSDKTEVAFFEYVKKNNVIRLEASRIIGEKKLPNFPLAYLGFEFYGYQTLLKSKNLSSFYREMKESVATKAKRVERIKSLYLIDGAPIFKRKLYRLYSYKGVKTRFKVHKGRAIRYRGNFIRYALKASEIHNSPEIRKQIRNHWKILSRTIDKYEFSNNKK